MRRIMLAAVLGGLVLFAWNAVSWMALPFHEAALHPIPDGELVMGDLRARLKEPGVYHYPGTPADEAAGRGGPLDQAEWTRKWRRGPVVNLLVYTPQGSDPVQPVQYLNGLVLFIAVALIAAWLLERSLASLPRYGQRVAFVTTLGLFAAFSGPLMQWNWFHFPADYVAVEFADAVIGWLLAGLVIARLVRPAVQPA